MNIHIGEIIEQKFQESGLKLPVFAERINTGERNVYSIFKRKDINAGMLKLISEVLEYDFFELYSSTGTTSSERTISPERTITLNLSISIAKARYEVIPQLLHDISEAGSKYGVKIL